MTGDQFAALLIVTVICCAANMIWTTLLLDTLCDMILKAFKEHEREDGR